MAGRVVLVRAELVEVVVAGGVLEGGAGLLRGEGRGGGLQGRRGRGHPGLGAGSSSRRPARAAGPAPHRQRARQELAPAQVEGLRGDLPGGELEGFGVSWSSPGEGGARAWMPQVAQPIPGVSGAPPTKFALWATELHTRLPMGEGPCPSSTRKDSTSRRTRSATCGRTFRRLALPYLVVLVGFAMVDEQRLPVRRPGGAEPGAGLAPCRAGRAGGPGGRPGRGAGPGAGPGGFGRRAGRRSVGKGPSADALASLEKELERSASRIASLERRVGKQAIGERFDATRRPHRRRGAAPSQGRRLGAIASDPGGAWRRSPVPAAPAPALPAGRAAVARTRAP